LPLIEARLGRAVDAAGRERLLRGIPGLQPRARTLVELADVALFYVAAPAPALLGRAAAALAGAPAFAAGPLEAALRELAQREGVRLSDIAQPLRAALTGSTASPPIFDVMEALGREETLRRVAAVAAEAVS